MDFKTEECLHIPALVTRPGQENASKIALPGTRSCSVEPLQCKNNNNKSTSKRKPKQNNGNDGYMNNNKRNSNKRNNNNRNKTRGVTSPVDGMSLTEVRRCLAEIRTAWRQHPGKQFHATFAGSHTLSRYPNITYEEFAFLFITGQQHKRHRNIR